MTTTGNAWMNTYPTECDHCGQRIYRTLRDGQAVTYHADVNPDGTETHHVRHTDCPPAPIDPFQPAQ